MEKKKIWLDYFFEKGRFLLISLEWEKSGEILGEWKVYQVANKKKKWLWIKLLCSIILPSLSLSDGVEVRLINIYSTSVILKLYLERDVTFKKKFNMSLLSYLTCFSFYQLFYFSDHTLVLSFFLENNSLFICLLLKIWPRPFEFSN